MALPGQPNQFVDMLRTHQQAVQANTPAYNEVRAEVGRLLKQPDTVFAERAGGEFRQLQGEVDPVVTEGVFKATTAALGHIATVDHGLRVVRGDFSRMNQLGGVHPVRYRKMEVRLRGETNHETGEQYVVRSIALQGVHDLLGARRASHIVAWSTRPDDATRRELAVVYYGNEPVDANFTNRVLKDDLRRRAIEAMGDTDPVRLLLRGAHFTTPAELEFMLDEAASGMAERDQDLIDELRARAVAEQEAAVMSHTTNLRLPDADDLRQITDHLREIR